MGYSTRLGKWIEKRTVRLTRIEDGTLFVKVTVIDELPDYYSVGPSNVYVPGDGWESEFADAWNKHIAKVHSAEDQKAMERIKELEKMLQLEEE